HHEDALVEADEADGVGHEVAEGGQRRLVHDRPRVHRAATRAWNPRGGEAGAARACGPRREARRAAGCAALDAELVAAAARPELGRVRQRQRRQRHRVRRSAPEGSLAAAATKTISASGTWQVDSPRSWRTASVKLLKPWMNASESWPPWVLTGSRPSGQRIAPFSTKGPPSPGAQK